MEECELCGKRVNDIYIVNVEDVELRVCTKCAQGKKVVSKISNQPKPAKQFVAAKRSEVEQLVENYGTLIHNARESMKLPIRVLAEMLNEKETHLLHVEQQKTLPSEELRKKLEKALGIRLVDRQEVELKDQGGRSGGDTPTLGDFVGA